MTNYTYEQIREAVQECTSYDIVCSYTDEYDEHYEYILVDPFGDQDGDPFADLDDVLDFVTDNDQVNQYLLTEFN